jgi:PH (Pleckstrin Homology) domain-containing protein
VTTIEFRAPWGRTVRVRTTIGLVMLAVMMLGPLLAPFEAPTPFIVALIGLPPLIVAASLARCVRGYTLTEDAITIRRGIGTTRLALAGLRSVTGQVDAMRGSFRLTGNDGFFAITGRYWNKTLGWHRAFATDLSRAVVLRYPKRTIVITPHDPQHFIMRARTFLKVADFPK